MPHAGRRVLADKGYVNRNVALRLAQTHGVYLITLTRKNQKKHALPPELHRAILHWREICETAS